ncbi:MAG: hypothetical protein ACWA5W_02625, partial [Phycisphaerales bacterium]
MDPRPPIQSVSAAALTGLGFGHHAEPINILDTVIINQDHPDPLGVIEETVGRFPQTATLGSDPRASGWLIVLSYELGRLLEPKACTHHQLHHPSGFPLAVLQRWAQADSPLAPDPARFTLGSF